ncbi:MAG: hypothetical protein QM767_18005 [Anaeromyxobacter sp.]
MEGPPPLPPAPPAAPPPLSEAPQTQGRTFPCARCGAELTYAIGAAALRCSYCGYEQPLTVEAGAAVLEHDLQAALSRGAAARPTADAAPGRQELRCDSCGATVVFDGTLTSSACSFCGVPVQRDRVHQAADRLPVDGVLPFAVEAGQARGALASWVKGLWFAPNDFRKRGVDGDLQGVYLPFFTFDAMTSTTYQGQRGEHYWVTVGSGQNERREMRTRWYPASGAFQRFFDDVLVPAFRALPAPLLTQLEPWPLGGCLPFTPEALAGKLAHTYDVELPPSFQAARERIDGALREEVEERIGGDEQRITDLTTGYAALTFKHLLLPVWLLAYRYREKSYRVAINACTGEVHGERPWSVVKITFAAILAAVVAALIYTASQQ